MRQNINFGKLLHGGDYNPEQWLSVLYSLSVFYMARHTYMKRFQTKIQNKCMLRGLNTSKIPHQLCRTFGNKCTFLTKFLCICNPMIGIIRLTQPRKLICLSHPVKMTTVNNRPTDSSSVTIHIFGRRMCHNICSPLNRTTIYRSREGVIHDQRNPMCMSCLCKLLNILINIAIWVETCKIELIVNKIKCNSIILKFKYANIL